MDRNYKKVAEGVVEMTGVDIFLNTRQRNYVELRALVCYILREKLGMRWTNIAYYFESMGKTMNHATVIHLVKNYETYKMYNSSLQEIEDTFNFKSELNYDEIDKIHSNNFKKVKMFCYAWQRHRTPKRPLYKKKSLESINNQGFTKLSM